jgi:hypothetical protein
LILKYLPKPSIKFVICWDLNVSFLTDPNLNLQLILLLQFYNMFNIIDFSTRTTKNFSSTGNILIDYYRVNYFEVFPLIKGHSDHAVQYLVTTTKWVMWVEQWEWRGDAEKDVRFTHKCNFIFAPKKRMTLPMPFGHKFSSPLYWILPKSESIVKLTCNIMKWTEYIMGINWYLRISDTVGEVSHKLVIINGDNCNCGK